jgi:hypothetical protein
MILLFSNFPVRGARAFLGSGRFQRAAVGILPGTAEPRDWGGSARCQTVSAGSRRFPVFAP